MMDYNIIALIVLGLVIVGILYFCQWWLNK